ncbi:MAG: class I SAM-dependent methyltransferase [Atopobiaceae bacterium]
MEDQGNQMDERAVTQAGDPSNPHGVYGERMLERMNRSHADLTNWALDQLTYEAGEHALDIGCGGGATMGRIAQRIQAAGGGGHVSGIDHSEVACRASRQLNQVAIQTGQMDVSYASVESLPFPDATFDLVTTVESFYFWPDPPRSLAEVARVVKPDGRFLLVADVYRRPDLAPETLQNIEHYNLTVLTPSEYENLLVKAGFSSAKTHLREGTTWIAVEAVK